LRPEMASLTVGSMNFPKYASVNPPDTIKTLATLMAKNGILPELEIFEPGFINYALYLLRKGVLKEPLHFNLLLGSLGSVPAGLRDLTYLVDSLPPNSVWAATGIGRYQTQINLGAMLMGGHVRVGVEDSIYYHYPKKELATNESLVKRIVRMADEIGREVATPDEARGIIGLKPRKLD
jgi:3-keto-5-aminohexanoate cleavage enzyme